MNSTIDNTDVATTRQPAARPARPRRATPTPAPLTVEELAAVPGDRPASELTRLVFMVILGAAACIALIGVVSEAGTTGTSPDDPAPAVIVHEGHDG